MQAIYHQSPEVVLGSNVFVNVPVILKYEDVNLVEVANLIDIGYSLEIPIYHSDGTYLAKVRRNRVYPTEEGKKVGVNIIQNEGQVVCELAGKEVFELRRLTGESFKLNAELFVPDGNLVKLDDRVGLLGFTADNEKMQIGDLTISGSKFTNLSIGIHVKSNGEMIVGVG